MYIVAFNNRQISSVTVSPEKIYAEDELKIQQKALFL